MIKDKNNIIKGGLKPIVYDCFYSETSKPKPLVIFCHGYKGFKDWGAWDQVAEAFVKAGFFFVKFNFSHNGGTIYQPIDFPDLEAFSENNYSIELDDLDRVINHFNTTKKHHQEINQSMISIIGHSRGGGIALIKAEEDTRISKLVTWASVSDFKSRYKEGTNQFEKWKTTGKLFVENARTKQQMHHNWQFYDNFINNENRLTIKRAASEIEKPWLIIHGDNDTSVPLTEGQSLHKWNANSSIEIIKDANHVFESIHPWDNIEMPKNLKKVVERTIHFLK